MGRRARPVLLLLAVALLILTPGARANGIPDGDTVEEVMLLASGALDRVGNLCLDPGGLRDCVFEPDKLVDPTLEKLGSIVDRYLPPTGGPVFPVPPTLPTLCEARVCELTT